MTVASRKISFVRPVQHTEAHWLDLTDQISRMEKELFVLRQERAILKPKLMTKLSQWGLRDETITAILQQKGVKND